MRILWKLLLSAAIGLIALVLVAAQSWQALSSHQAAVTEIYSVRFKNIREMSWFVIRLSRIHASLYKVTSLASSSDDTRMVNTLAQQQLDAADALLMELQAWFSSSAAEGNASVAGPILASLKEYRRHSAGVADIATTDIGMANIYMTLAERSFQSIAQALDQIQAQHNASVQVSYERLVAESRRALLIFGLVFVAGVALVMVSSLLVSRAIIRPVSATERFIEEMARGHLSGRVAVESTDELGRMCSGLNTFVAKVGGIVADVSEKSNKVTRASELMASTANRLLEDARAQALGAAALSGLATDISKSVTQVTESVSSTSQQTNSIRERAAGGGAIIKEAIHGILEASASVDSAAGTLAGLQLSTREIEGVLATIRDIAEETYVLAINATIEAARAGAEGASFAIIASEIRKLSQRTTTSTRSISTMVAALRASSSEVAAAVTRGVDEVARGATRADHASAALEDILRGIEQVGEMTARVEAASKQQSCAVTAVMEHIETVAKSAKSFSDGTTETSEAAGALHRIAEGLRDELRFFK